MKPFNYCLSSTCYESEIEEIQGVSFATNTLEILFELDWVKLEKMSAVFNMLLLKIF